MKTNLTLGIVSLSMIMGCSDNKSTAEGSEQSPPNILFIAVDDLRPELGIYGVSAIQSPNIDRLAKSGFVFTRSYCNIPVCGASRASLLTGTRPTRNTWITFHDTISAMRPGVPTLGMHFQENGYHTIHNGKIMHHPGDAAGSWSEEWWPSTRGSWRDYVDPANVEMDKKDNRGPAWERLPVADTSYKDGKIAEKTIADLKKLKESGEPFFLAAGFFKPHLPFNAPEKYWDLYDSTDIVLPDNNYQPKNTPNEAMHNWGELRSYYGIPSKGPLSDKMAHTLKHGYYACVSYTDAQIGKVLDALDELGLADNTIVILWGDHGWNLREHGLWCKHCNFETSLHTPLIMRIPGMKGNQTLDAVTEYVDIYPTLCELTSIEIPGHAEGNSLVPLLTGDAKDTDGIVFCRWFNGYTLIKDQYFYTEWWNEADSTYTRMLYDHNTDPDENLNISGLPENSALVEELSRQLKAARGENFDL